MLAPTIAAICIMSMVSPSFILVRSVSLPDLLLEFVFLKIGRRVASATMNLPAFSAFPFLVFVCNLFGDQEKKKVKLFSTNLASISTALRQKICSSGFYFAMLAVFASLDPERADKSPLSVF